MNIIWNSGYKSARELSFLWMAEIECEQSGRPVTWLW